MALFSEFDWLILLGVGALILLGPGNTGLLRTIGRYYGRLMRLKQELLAEVTRAADLPTPAPGGSFSLRRSLLASESSLPQASGIPAAVAVAPVLAAPMHVPPPPPVAAWGYGVWSVATPAPSLDARGRS